LLIPVRIDGGAGGIGDISDVEALAYCGHGGFYFGVEAGGGRGKHGGAEGAGLFGGVDADGSVHDVSHHLHDKGRLFCNAAETDEAFDGDAFADKAVDDGFCAEAGGFGDRMKDLWGVGAEVQAGDGAFKQLVGVGSAAAVQPIEGQRVVGGRFPVGR